MESELQEFDAKITRQFLNHGKPIPKKLMQWRDRWERAIYRGGIRPMDRNSDNCTAVRCFLACSNDNGFLDNTAP